MGITDPHPISEQTDYFLNRVLPAHPTRLALRDEALVGFEPIWQLAGVQYQWPARGRDQGTMTRDALPS